MAQTFDTPIFTSDQSLDRVLNAGLPVVLVFTDGSPSSNVQEAAKSLARQEAGNILVAQINRKDSPQAAQRFQVRAVPAVVTYKNGQVQSQAENITGQELERHGGYVLGKGPKPEARPQQSGYATQQPYGQAGASRPGTSAGGQTGQPVTVTDATFDQEVMRSPVPVIVDFWAPWCGPCRMVAPILEKLAREWSGKAKIAKVNVDENPMVAGRYGISGIPTMMVVQNGKIVDQWAGAMPEPSMRSRLGRFVK